MLPSDLVNQLANDRIRRLHAEADAWRLVRLAKAARAAKAASPQPRPTSRAASATTAVIRPARSKDLDGVARIFAHYVTSTVTTFEETPPTRRDWRRRLDELADRGLPFLVAEACDEVVGYAYASPWRPKPAYRHTVEDSIYLAPAWTGKGLGRALLDTLLAQCARAGVRQVVAVIADTGEGTSAALHRAFGFAEVGRLGGVGYKHGRWLDTMLLQRDLTTGRADGR